MSTQVPAPEDSSRNDLPNRDDPTVGRLVADASRDVSKLIHDEIALVKSELRLSVKTGGTGLGLFAGAALLGLLAIIMLSVAFAYLLHLTGLDLAWCFLIVFAVYLLVAGLLAFLASRRSSRCGAPNAPSTRHRSPRRCSSVVETSQYVEIPGPWQHRYVAANGARFHVVEATAPEPAAAGAPNPGEMVLLLHGFPEFWWAWRAQLPALAAAGHRAVAMDLRGYGGSDKTPRGYDPTTLAGDVSGVVKALGARSAVLVGHGWGGYVAWATAVMHPRQVSALCAVSAPHPSTLLHPTRRLSWLSGGIPAAAWRHVLAMQLPMRPERRLADPGSGYLARHLRSWSATGSAFPDDETVAAYQRAMALWPAPHCALEYHRWLVRSRVRADGRRFNQTMRAPVLRAVCCVSGDADPALPRSGGDDSRPHVRGPFTEHRMPGVGHYPHEEDPETFTTLLTGWLANR